MRRSGDTSRPAIGLGLVGVGKIARDQHLPAIAGLSDFTLVAMASRDADRQPDVPYRSLGEMLAAEPDVAAITLACPPVGRAGLAREALRAGKHVMLEKPPCATVAEGEALADLARARGLTLFAGWHLREAAKVGAASAWLANKTIQSAAIAWREDIRVWHPGQDWILAEGGMGVFDPGINAFSILTVILPGAITLIEADLAVPANRESPIRARLSMRHGAAASVSADFDFLYTGEPHWTIEVATDAGLLRLDQGGTRLMIDGQPPEIGPNTEYPGLYKRFADLVHSGTSDVDLRPLALVTEALRIGVRRTVSTFHF
ncbi:Gfo/Idh/MocA family protein [Parablastomonas sp. CN1-191]|uniref:Gfo/Idh/MocA family protein n=1 Tax=Parablastomonas sp. CN1-191 TaxID=3400908 RepID=UPI003BF7B95C